ncbi:MAG: chemotaxis protein CheD [Saprospiraceae bacterium]|nr:chemotaxis protein CheD [Saprospiraceae bacterium]
MDDNPAKIMKYVNTGEVRSGGSDTILNSGAIGSCVVVTAFDSEKKIGGMAHIMLPGICPYKNHLHTNRYAANAIEEILSQLKKFGINKEKIEICIIGGANVLKRENDTIGKDNLDSVEKLLSERQIRIKAKAIGGVERRTVLFDIAKSCIHYTVGDSKQKILWQTGSH